MPNGDPDVLSVRYTGPGSGGFYLFDVSYTGDASTGAVTGGHDLVLYNPVFAASVPEPSSLVLFCLGSALALAFATCFRPSHQGLDYGSRAREG